MNFLHLPEGLNIFVNEIFRKLVPGMDLAKLDREDAKLDRDDAHPTVPHTDAKAEITIYGDFRKITAISLDKLNKFFGLKLK